MLPAEKARSDKFFDNMDPWKTGFIDGDAAVPFLSKSKLPDEVLAHIWYVFFVLSFFLLLFSVLFLLLFF